MREITFVPLESADTITVSAFLYEKGRAMDTAKDMWKVYSKQSTAELITNRNRKYRQLLRLGSLDGYFVRKERARLEHMIKQLEAVIAQRALQPRLF